VRDDKGHFVAGKRLELAKLRTSDRSIIDGMAAGLAPYEDTKTCVLRPHHSVGGMQVMRIYGHLINLFPFLNDLHALL